jgi:hypothetical protein
MYAALVEEVLGMEESVTYQAIFRKGWMQGRVEEARHILVLQGEQKFERPGNAAVRLTLESIDDILQLEALSLRLLDVNSWQELFLTKNGRPVHR